FLICRAVIPVMLEQGRGGSIVNIASISGMFAAPNHASYGAAKAGIIALTRSLAVEYGPAGIRVNAVSPGQIATPATSDRITPEAETNARKMIPLGRSGRPEDIARAVL